MPPPMRAPLLQMMYDNLLESFPFKKGGSAKTLERRATATGFEEAAGGRVMFVTYNMADQDASAIPDEVARLTASIKSVLDDAQMKGKEPDAIVVCTQEAKRPNGRDAGGPGGPHDT